MTQLKLQESPPMGLSYLDGKNIIKVDDSFYLIAQCGTAKMVVFEICDGMEWNRECEPVEVLWSNLNTTTICELIPMFAKKNVQRVNMNITFQLK